MCWLEGMFSEIRFQLQEGIEPFAVAGKDGRAFMQDSEGGFLCCRHGFEFPVMIRCDKAGERSQTCALFIDQDALSTRYGEASDACPCAPGQGD